MSHLKIARPSTNVNVVVIISHLQLSRCTSHISHSLADSFNHVRTAATRSALREYDHRSNSRTAIHVTQFICAVVATRCPHGDTRRVVSVQSTDGVDVEPNQHPSCGDVHSRSQRHRTHSRRHRRSAAHLNALHLLTRTLRDTRPVQRPLRRQYPPPRLSTIRPRLGGDGLVLHDVAHGRSQVSLRILSRSRSYHERTVHHDVRVRRLVWCTDRQSSASLRASAADIRRSHHGICVVSILVSCYVLGERFTRALLPPRQALAQTTSIGFIPASMETVLTGHKKPKKHIDTLHLPMCTYQPGMFNADDRICPICISEFAYGDQLRVLLCAHHFHTSCVDEWLQKQEVSQCPICRQKVETDKPNNNTLELMAIAEQTSASSSSQQHSIEIQSSSFPRSDDMTIISISTRSDDEYLN